MRYIIHRSLAAYQDPVLNDLADQVFAESSYLSKNLSSKNQMWLCEHDTFDASNFQPQRVREVHVVFLSGSKDLTFIELLKTLPMPPCVIWSDFKVSEAQLNHISAPIDVYVKNVKNIEDINYSLHSGISKEEICLRRSNLQVAPILIASMVDIQETLFERLQLIGFRMFATCPRVVELGDGKFQYKSILIKERSRACSDSTIFIRQSNVNQTTDQCFADVGAEDMGSVFFHQEENRLKAKIQKIVVDARATEEEKATKTTPWSFWKSEPVQLATIVGATVALGIAVSYFRRGK